MQSRHTHTKKYKNEFNSSQTSNIRFSSEQMFLAACIVQSSLLVMHLYIGD